MSIERGDVTPLRWATYADMTDAEIAEYNDEPDNSDEAVESRRTMFEGFGWGVTR